MLVNDGEIPVNDGDMSVRGEFNQECQSIHKIRMNKVTEVVNSL